MPCLRFRGTAAPSFVLRALATLVLLPCVAFAKSDPVPDWVRAAAALPARTYSPLTDAVILLDDTTVTVAPNGTATRHRRRVIKILRPQGREDASIFIPFSNDQKLLNLHIWSISPEGHEYTLKDNEIGEVGYPGQGNFYVDERARVANAPGRDPGGIVAYEYEKRDPAYLNESDWAFQSELPAVNESLTLELPPGYTFHAVWAHHPQLQPADLEHARWRWQITDVPAVDLHDSAMAPAPVALAGRMALHYNGPGVTAPVGDSWQSIGQWYGNLAGDREVATPELAAKAHELAGASTDFYDRTLPIAEFVQRQIRYFVIERGIGGLQPHPAAEIFHNRFGDCKDKATLLAAMLSAVGVHADLMMVDSRRGVVDPDAPSLFGNHMIVALEIPAGYTSPKLHSVVTAADGRRYLIFDPTHEKIPFGQLESGLQGSYGVLVAGDHSQVIQLPVLAPELNRVHRTATFHLAADGSLQGSVTEQRFGDAAVRRRYLYAERDEHQQSLFLDRLLRQDLNNVSVSGYKVENLDTLSRDLTTTYSLTSEHFGQTTGPLLMVRPRVLGTEDLRPDRHERHIPVDFSETLQAQDDFTIELPAGYTAEELPDPVKLDLGFAAYESKTTLEGNSLHFARTYTVRQVTLPADRYADVQKLAGVIAYDEGNRAILKKP